MKNIDYFNLSLTEVFAEAEAIAGDARTHFGHLDSQQINWKPADDRWSVGQCLDHLIASNRAFYPQFDQIVSGAKQPTLWEKMPVIPGLFGKMLIKALLPGNTQKYKAPPTVQPSASVIDPQIVTTFINHQCEVIAKLKALEMYKPDKTVITSPFLKVMTYSVLDAGRIVVVHERRHFAQAQRVMETGGFPK
jgi:hypothetical protein